MLDHASGAHGVGAPFHVKHVLPGDGVRQVDRQMALPGGVRGRLTARCRGLRGRHEVRTPAW
jgi:hypothetical protein